MGAQVYNLYERYLFIEPGTIQLKFQNGAVKNMLISGTEVQK